MDNKLVSRLLASFSSLTEILFSLAIDHNVSPLFTVYVFLGGNWVAVVGIFRVSPICKLTVVKLFSSNIYGIVTLNFLDIDHRLSPF